MVTLKRLLYCFDEATTENDLYMSIRDACRFFHEEDFDPIVIYNRVNSQINKHRHLFIKKKISGVAFYKLSQEGLRYLNHFKSTYDPTKDENFY